jgi:hypothetical protein
MRIFGLKTGSNRWHGGENYLIRSFIICTLHKMLQHLGEQIEEDKKRKVCGMHRRDEKCVKNFGQKT